MDAPTLTLPEELLLLAADLTTAALADFGGAAKLGFRDARSRMLAAPVSAVKLTRRVLADSGDTREARRTMRALRRELWPAKAVAALIRAEAGDGG